MGNPAKAAMASCVAQILGLMFMVFIILFSTSFKIIYPNQRGVFYNSLNRQLSDSCPADKCADGAWLPGRHFIGFWMDFHVYPSMLQTIEFSERKGADAGIISAGTSSGLTIRVACTIYFRL